MPKQKDLKRLVRTRMRKTGESYTTARAQLVRKQEPARDLAALAGMSDDAVKKKTGRTWRGWVRALDAAKATSMPHRDIARLLHEQHGLPGWWAQMVTVGYERIRGLREKGQRRGAGYDVNKSKTFPVPIAKLYAAFGARTRPRWLGDARPTVKKASREKSMRLRWDDGSPVEAYFTAKGDAKSQVAVQHRNLPSKAAATKMKDYWAERLVALADLLNGSPPGK